MILASGSPRAEQPPDKSRSLAPVSDQLALRESILHRLVRSGQHDNVVDRHGFLRGPKQNAMRSVRVLRPAKRQLSRNDIPHIVLLIPDHPYM
jgi:hypothetical protein